ncbi:MAG TPA: hypothetical protein VKE73_04825 [Myxococcota bacterium]|nr:hypothetical protein [Myxococcota bacterium]
MDGHRIARVGLVAGLATCACFAPGLEAHAADPSDVNALQQQLTATQDELAKTKTELQETKDTLKALKQRVEDLAASAPAPASPLLAPGVTARLAPVNADNPAISFVVDTTARTNTHGDGGNPVDGGNGFALRSGELFISAPIDPFLRGYATINGNTTQGFDIEEAAVVTTALPWNLTVKGGRYFADVGRLSHWHDEALPFVDRPPSLNRIIGGESRAEGVEVSWLAPTEHFIQITGGVYNSIGEQAGTQLTNIVGVGSYSELTYLVHPSTYFDLTDTFNVEVGGTYFGVPKDHDRHLYGVDVTFRHQPGTSGFYQGTTLGVEWLWNNERFANQTPLFNATGAPLLTDPTLPFNALTNPQLFGSRLNARQGGYAYFESFFGRRFSAGFRFDYSEAPSDNVNTSLLYLAPLSPNPDQIVTYSWFLTWMPSEFHRLRLQLDQIVARGEPDDQRITLQWTAFLGSHSHGFTTR